jgi:ferredoxin
VAAIEFFKVHAGNLERVGTVDFVEPNLNLLAHAQAIELDLGSECGGHGKCGADVIRILTGAEALSDITEAERKHLSPDQLASGVRLGCQIFPNDANRSLRIEIGFTTH